MPPSNGSGRDIFLHPAPDLATAHSAFHDYLLPQPWWQTGATQIMPTYRALLIRGLERGSIAPATLLRDGQPGAAIVELAAHDRVVPADGRVDRARRARADLAWELRRLVGAELGTQVGAWQRILTGVQETAHSFARLAHDRVFFRGLEIVSRHGLWDRWTVTNTLLAVAPESVELLREILEQTAGRIGTARSSVVLGVSG